jgi:hypothetical protein
MKYVKNYSLDLFQIFLLLFVPVFISLIAYRIIPIENVEPTSIVSATSAINAILWTLIVTQVIINYPLIRNYSLNLVLQINLLFILIYVSAIKILIKALSLKGTPLPGSDIRGDLLNIVNLAKIAQSQYWSGGPNPIFPDGGYPPVWPSLIGNIAGLLDRHVLSIFKPAEFLLLLISPVIVLYIWRLILENWMALVVATSQTLIYDFSYKTITLNVLIPALIFIVLKIKDSSPNKVFIYGIFLGVVSMTYFGYIYWLIPLMLTIIPLILFSKDREKYINLHTHLYLGLGIGLGPVIYFRVTSEIAFYYSILFVGYLLLFLFKNNKSILRIILSFTTLGMFIGLLWALFYFRTLDSWIYDDIDKKDPTVDSIISLNGMGIFIFLAIIIGLYFIIEQKNQISTLFMLVGIYISSSIFMYFIASQMQITGRVDLWPRALEVQYISLTLIYLLLFLFILDKFHKEKLINKFFEPNSRNYFYLTSFGLFILGSFLVSSLGSHAHASMPYHAFNAAWFAHQGCSNPHEDPMLAKVFESNPDIQEFLRENCSSVVWAEIPKIN